MSSRSSFLRSLTVAAALAIPLALGWATPAHAQSGAPDGDWPYYGGDMGATRFSPLDQIDASNVADLEIAWRWSAANFGPEPEGRSQVTPIEVNGVLYTTAGSRRDVVAIDATTGETLWFWRMDEGRRWEEAPRRNSGRGVAYWEEDGSRRIFVATPGHHLVALDADTGGPVESFADGGVLDMMEGLRLEGARSELDPVGLIGNSSPPVVVNDVVIVGPAFLTGFQPESRINIPGDIRGWDARTGELLWTFHTIPTPGEFGHDTWEDDAWTFVGNAGVWTSFTADPELGIVYLPVESATSDATGGHRPGDNLFTSTLVALDAATGERVWHYQLVHHDIWDWDIGTPPILVDLVVDGEPIAAVAQPTKQGFVFVFDRATGEPVWPIEERPVPQTDVPGEWTSPTQPFPTQPPPFARQGVSEDDLIDFTPEIRADALAAVSDIRLGPLYTPGSLADAPDGTRGTLMSPSAAGAIAWEAGAFDPASGILYMGVSTSATLLALVNDPETSDLALIAGDIRPPRVRNLPIIEPPWGEIVAVDLNDPGIEWRVPNGESPDYVTDHPDLQGLDIPPTGKPTRAGLFVTPTLLFGGEGSGGSPVFRAWDKGTGEVLAEIDLPGTQTGLPMTYEVDGQQYVVVTVSPQGGISEAFGAVLGPELVALRLP